MYRGERAISLNTGVFEVKGDITLNDYPLTYAATGKILINGSVHADIAVKRHGVYSMCKAANQQLTRVLAVELAKHRINVNGVNPGWIDTPNERTFVDEDQLQSASQKLPWKRLGRPEEIANAFVYLASSDADYISGHTLVVDGALEWDFGDLVSGLDSD